MKRYSVRGFTLIELLVVVAIIGVLGTLSVTSFIASREKARITRGASFSSQLLRGLGDSLIGRWDFNECSGTIATDQSGYNNNATLINATWSTNTPSGKDCSASFNGTNGYINGGNTSSLNIRAGGTVTMCAWVYPSNTGGYYGIVGKRNSDNYAYGMNFANSADVIMVYTSGASGVQQFSYKIPEKKWTHVCGIIATNSPTSLYIDGALFGTAGSGGGVAYFPTTSLYIGTSFTTGEYFPGQIDDVRLYSVSLTSKDIRNIYAESASRYIGKNE